MPIKNYKTNKSARKKASIVDRSELYRGKPFKKLATGKKRLSGRGSAGKITIRHRGGGAKRLLRDVDFGQDKQEIKAKVERLEYDPNRTAWLALLLYVDGERRYVLSWNGAKVGDQVVTGAKVAEKPGNRMQLKNVTPGSTVFNVEIRPGRSGRMFRAAGTAGIVMDVQDDHVLMRMPSSEVRLISKESYGTFGRVSNVDWWLTRIGSAGRVRRMGRRPVVRGKVMNPVDHPHGGGEGAQPIGMPHPKTKWGKPALGVKTRAKGKYSDGQIISRRKKKKRK